MYSAPVAGVLAIAVLWYWIRLGRADIPISRRRIRRSSLAIILVTIPVLFGALSLIDPTVRGSAYVILWSVAMICLLLIVVTAVVDALNSMRLHREAAHEEAVEATANIIRALQKHDDRAQVRSAQSTGQPLSDNGAVE